MPSQKSRRSFSVSSSHFGDPVRFLLHRLIVSIRGVEVSRKCCMDGSWCYSLLLRELLPCCLDLRNCCSSWELKSFGWWGCCWFFGINTRWSFILCALPMRRCITSSLNFVRCNLIIIHTSRKTPTDRYSCVDCHKKYWNCDHGIFQFPPSFLRSGHYLCTVVPPWSGPASAGFEPGGTGKTEPAACSGHWWSSRWSVYMAGWQTIRRL